MIIVLSLIPLLVFKYANFFLQLTTLEEHSLELILPLGISFYTFSIIGYYIDIFNRKINPVNSYTELINFLAYWPHLASGPVLRAEQIFLRSYEEASLNSQNVALSLMLIASGLFKKLLIADNIGAYVNWNFSLGIEGMNALQSWVTLLGFSCQIYADFSGYSDMALGFSLLLGYSLPANFNYPYLATSLTEFWHRWHISLSSWLRDYIYFPLGGSQKGNTQTHLNILVVFLVSGFWHGAGINFILWGGLHGLFLIIEKSLGDYYRRLNPLFRWFTTNIIVIALWSLFRLDLLNASLLLKKMFGFGPNLLINSPTHYHTIPIVLMLTPLLLDHAVKFYQVNKEGYPYLNNRPIAVYAMCALIPLFLIFNGKPLPFIYFNF